MKPEAALEYFHEKAKGCFPKDKCGKGHICPICGSGSGKNGTGMTTTDGIRYTCWAGCFSNADIVDIIGAYFGTTGFKNTMEKAGELFGIEIEWENGKGMTYQKQAKKERKEANQEKLETDYTAFFLEANKALGETDYHRGLSMETLNRFKVGYVAEWKHPEVPDSVPRTPRLIIPTSKYSYVARDTRAYPPAEQEKYKKQKVGKVRIFNAEALKEAQSPIFVVEGEIDALSIIDVGGEAVGLGSTSSINLFLKMLEENRPNQPLILCMDNDEAGVKANAKLLDGLDKLHITYHIFDIAKPHKDANERLVHDREGLAEAVIRAEGLEVERLEAEKEELQREAVSFALNDFLANIEASQQAPFFSTGFPALDKVLDGGLYAGLYFIGAISSLGKTTFCLQVADQIAQQGQDVLIFSLEMARNELIAKSLSRLTLIKDLELNGSTANAKTTRGILTGKRWPNYNLKERELIQKALEAYQTYGQHIYITEGMGNVGVNEIRQKVERHVRLVGKPPAIVIDYLQILAPADVRATDKQNIDKAVLELKRLSRDYNVPVIGVSSFNRDNYTSPVNPASFKESGAIEYSSDVLIGLQYKGMDFQDGEKDGDRQKRVRLLFKEMADKGKAGKAQNIELKVLKNRNGSKGDVELEFYPMFNYFKSKIGKEEENCGSWSKVSGKYGR